MDKSTNIFEKRFKKILKFEEDENTVDAALGSSGPYPVEDVRIPVYLGATTRNGKINRRKRKKKNKK